MYNLLKTFVETKPVAETVIDLRSDTVSQPTERMREAMSKAIVGDDIYGEDPTMKELEMRCAKLFEKEAALFVPSGTMGNLIAILSHCRERGAEAIIGHSTHIYLYEQGGASHIAGVMLNVIPNNDDGTFSLDEFRSKIREDDQHVPVTALAVVENTHNVCGGKVISLDWIDEFVSICKAKKVKMHMDGARIFHASNYLNIPVARISRDFDSITFCLSKSLCAPVGSILVGSHEFIHHAIRMRKALGGAMRQTGILAAAALVALDDIVPKLGNDHLHTKQLAQAIYDLKSPFCTVDIDAVQTNICMVYLLQPKKYSANYLMDRLQQVTSKELSAGVTDKNGNGIVVKVFARSEWNCVRYVMYYHINDDLTELAIKKFKYCIEEMN